MSLIYILETENIDNKTIMNAKQPAPASTVPMAQGKRAGGGGGGLYILYWLNLTLDSAFDKMQNC